MFGAALLLAGALLALTPRPCTSFDVRVAKGFYQRPYDAVRLSIIGGSPAPGYPYEEAPSLGPSAYRSPFIHRWTTKTLQSKIVHVGSGGTSIDFGNGERMHLKLPPKGSGATGLFFSDPCFTGRGGFRCANGEKFKILERLTFILNRLLGSDEFDFWVMLGDNFYDILGGVSSEFFARLSLKAKSKPLLAVIGNHDFWLGGRPPGGQGDELGYGFMQFYGQDTVAGQGYAPFDFAGNPDGLEIARAENFIYGTQIGDLALFGFSSAHDWGATYPHAAAFCNWVGSERTVNAVIVLGHWDECDLGCKPGMDTPSVFRRMKSMNGCNTKRVLMVAGHQHCNRVLDGSGDPVTAESFVVGGTGMWGPGCSQFGFSVLQSQPGAPGGPNVRMDNFPVAASDFTDVANRELFTMLPAYWDAPMSFDRFEVLASCLNRSSYAGCRRDHGQSLRALSEQDIVTPKSLEAIAREEGVRSSDQVARRAATTSTTTAALTTSTTTTTLTYTTTSTTFTLTYTTATTTTASYTLTTSTTTRSTTTTSTTSMTFEDARRSPPSSQSRPTTSGSEAWKDPLDIWAPTSNAASGSTPPAEQDAKPASVETSVPPSPEVTEEATVTALEQRAAASTAPPRPDAVRDPSPAPEAARQEHNCWDGLHDSSVKWPQEKVDWCCREMSLGCRKAAPKISRKSGGGGTHHGQSGSLPSKTEVSASTRTERGRAAQGGGNTTSHVLDQVLKRKPKRHADDEVGGEEAKQILNV